MLCHNDVNHNYIINLPPMGRVFKYLPNDTSFAMVSRYRMIKRTTIYPYPPVPSSLASDTDCTGPPQNIRMQQVENNSISHVYVISFLKTLWSKFPAGGPVSGTLTKQ